MRRGGNLAGGRFRGAVCQEEEALLAVPAPNTHGKEAGNGMEAFGRKLFGMVLSM